MPIGGIIMHIKEYEAEYTYNYDLDVVNIEIKEEYVHKKSIDLAFGVFLDFDENYLPVNLEIVSASKILNIKKDCLINPDGNVTITVGKDVVKVNVNFKFKNETESIRLNALNDFACPISETVLALS